MGKELFSKRRCVICGGTAYARFDGRGNSVCVSCSNADPKPAIGAGGSGASENRLNSCPDCNGSTTCRSCHGNGQAMGAQCGACNGAGRCPNCRKHVQFMATFLAEYGRREFGAAEATLQRAFIDAETDQAKSRLWSDILGKGGGSLLGTAIYPGIGTILGLIYGSMSAEAFMLTEQGKLTAWRKADLLFCLGALYNAGGRTSEAREALIKVLILNEHHAMARRALGGIDHGLYGI